MMAPLCKLHDVLHMFIMALTACPERGRHTNKLTEKSLERMLGRLFEKPQVLLQFLSQHCALSFTTSSTSPLHFFLSLSLNPHLSLLLPSVRSYRRAELDESGFSWRKTTEGRQRCDPLQVGKESVSFGHMV